MTISQTQLDQALSEPEIKKFWLGYFQESFREEIHQRLLELFEILKGGGFTRSDLAKKIGRRPEQVTRWLSSPNNLESDTISDLGLGMGVIPRLTFEPVRNMFPVARHDSTLQRDIDESLAPLQSGVADLAEYRQLKRRQTGASFSDADAKQEAPSDSPFKAAMQQ